MTLDLLWQRSRWLRLQRHRTDSPGGNILRVDFCLPPCTVFWSFTVCVVLGPGPLCSHLFILVIGRIYSRLFLIQSRMFIA